MEILNDNVLLEVVEEKQTGIMIADKDEKMMVGRGRVCGAGPGHSYGEPTFKATTVKVGDVALYIKQMAYNVEIKGKEYKIVKERDILLVL